MEFTDLRISTMTCLASLRGDVDLTPFFESVTLVPDDGVPGLSCAINWQRTRARPEGTVLRTQLWQKTSPSLPVAGQRRSSATAGSR
jgi:hypothetical protein